MSDWTTQTPAYHQWRRPVRWLHFALALTISLQMLNSLIMTPPFYYHTSLIGRITYTMHAYVGLFAAAVIALHWIWLLVDRHHLFAHLFPWGAKGRKQVIEDVRLLMQLRLPEEGDHGGLSGLVHGLGLLTATAMGGTGVGLYFMLGNVITPHLLLRLIASTHSLVSNLMWAYLGGHVLLAVVHHFIGHPTLKRMFTW